MEINTFKSRYAQYDDSQRAEYMKRAIAGMANDLISDGLVPNRISLGNDLTKTDYIAAGDLDPPVEPLAQNSLPNNKAWNPLKITRAGEIINVSLNDEPLVEFPVADPPKPGLLRPAERDARVRELKLTGDWPTEVPADLMQRSSSS